MNDPDGGDGSVDCLTDNADVYYYMDSVGAFELESPDRAAVSSTMSNEYAPTNLAIHYDSTPVFSGSGETDIIYQEGSKNLSENSIGVTWCEDGGEGSGRYALWECDQQYIRIRGNGTYDTSVACHETGHAVGLTHGMDAIPVKGNNEPRLGCMVTSDWNNNLGSSNVANINSVY
ncbi:hypothetical protein FFZ77_19395 [Streptomyces katsurahamanus]|uniref:Matrixin family metalloprotease n=3 Tax=Streptomyces TaxID=1883 RepID=A0A646KT44_STRJU|nr:hypothetical protein [Streptomyces katsurahamanus]MQT05207.1 hypothetical protein [Streptomyces jumonjinensis]